MSRIRTVCTRAVACASWTLAATAGTLGCSTNASNPTLDANRANFYQTESRTILVPATGLTLTVFTDQQGVFTKNNTTLNEITPGWIYVNGAYVWQGQTFAGLSSSAQVGLTWARHPPLQPVAPTQCPAGKDCPLLIRGDPWIATNGTRVLYSALAHTQYTTLTAINQANAYPSDAVAVARSESGTPDFGQFYVAARLPGQFVDKPSLDMLGDTALLAFVETSGTSPRVFTATTDASGTDTWYAPQLLFLPFSSFSASPYVKLATPTLAYLAYLEPYFTPVTMGTPRLFMNVVVARLTRTGGSSDWNATEIFRRNGSDMDATAPGGQQRPWRDIVPMNFSLGFQRKELHVAFRFASGSTGSDVDYFHCVDDPIGTCQTSGDGVTNPGWLRTPIPPVAPRAGVTLDGQRYQPWVEGHPTKRIGAVTWYGQRSADSSEYALAGALVDTASNTVLAAASLTAPYTACPTPGSDAYGQHFFGDYESTTFLFDYPSGAFFGTGTTEPVFLTTFARSSQCAVTGDLTSDQFVGSVLW